ncbi:hypothetical protein B0H10DRAFT_1965625 [Mycena sp. CBHHK59/15]|nr:hypothetical protein B0H10DRAFT_1965625 [Mycena sp. CBHHK59/15]
MKEQQSQDKAKELGPTREIKQNLGSQQALHGEWLRGWWRRSLIEGRNDETEYRGEACIYGTAHGPRSPAPLGALLLSRPWDLQRQWNTVCDPRNERERSRGPTMTAVARHANGRQKQTQTPEIQCGSTELRNPATPTSGSERGGENADGTGGNETGPIDVARDRILTGRSSGKPEGTKSAQRGDNISQRVQIAQIAQIAFGHVRHQCTGNQAKEINSMPLPNIVASYKVADILRRWESGAHVETADSSYFLKTKIAPNSHSVDTSTSSHWPWEPRHSRGSLHAAEKYNRLRESRNWPEMQIRDLVISGL